MGLQSYLCSLYQNVWIGDILNSIHRQMVFSYIGMVMQLSSIGLVIAAAGLWAGAGLDSRPRHKDEQTLVGGTIWSQIIIPIGLMISKIVEENINLFVQGYYLTTGILLLWITGIVLIVHELKKHYKRQEVLRLAVRETHSARTNEYDKVYYAIGIICAVAGTLKLCELIMFVIIE